MDENNFDSEDEDIVIEGSALHEHLHRLGYIDFESMSVHKTVLQKNNGFKFADLLSYVKTIFKKCFTIYSWIIQEEDISKKQLTTILDVKALLSDHACTITEFLEKYQSKSWRIFHDCILITAFTSSVYISLNTRYKIPTCLFVSSSILLVSYIKYLRLYAHREFKSIVSLQNDLFDLCTKGMKILRYGYKIKVNKGKCDQQFYDLTADRLKYLQPITETLVQYMECVSSIYYKVSLLLVKLLPENSLHQNILTRFESKSFQICGEINYQALKNLYYIYILSQSEMLQLLGIAYDCHTWHQSYSKIPELKLAYIIHCLNNCLTIHRNKLSKVTEDYYNFKVQPRIQNYRGPLTSKWQDLYVHLYLTSNKLQLAYNHILSILQDIDNTVSNTENDNESVETTMEKLNEAYKEIDAAKSFAEFSTLLVAKTRLANRVDNHVESNILTHVGNTDLPIITDSEPNIMDEVFEEYIKEEYLKPLHEESDEISLQNYKWDKFLAKNFMAELKDALIDKQKSMSERESKALQRMYNNIVKDAGSKVSYQQAPIPPPMPVLSPVSAMQEMPEFQHGCHIPEKSKKVPVSKMKEHSEKEILNDFSNEQMYPPVPFIPLPKIPFGTQTTNFVSTSSAPFLKDAEETFIGSGENSEDECTESPSDNEK